MKMKAKKYIAAGALFLLLFAVWTLLIRTVDVRLVGINDTNTGSTAWEIGQTSAEIGLSSLNTAFHALTGEHLGLYDLTDLLSFVPFVICAGFGVLGLVQWIKRKSVLKVDPDLILLGVYYVVVILFFFAFDRFAINYRPILIEGKMEPSYPSSTTLLVAAVIPTLIFQTNRRLRDRRAKALICVFSIAFAAFMIVGRTVCGVHWLTDIIGSCLLVASLFLLYAGFVALADGKKGRPSDTGSFKK